jgi:hypothetical protein
MSTDSPTDTGEQATDHEASETGSGGTGATQPELAAQVELLEDENRRLRAEYARARRSRYRRTAIGLAAVGAVAVLGGIAFPAGTTVLFSLGAIGVFAGLLTYYLTPERFVAATVGKAVYAAHANNSDAVVSELGLSEQHLYVPLESPTRAATLYVPQVEDAAVPPASALDAVFVVGENGQRGVSLRPAGGALLVEFERTLADPLADDPASLVDQLADGLIEVFELADGVDPELSSDGTQCVFGVTGSALGSVDRFDHPVGSFLATGVAVGLDRPVEMTVTTGDGRFDHRVTCSWRAATSAE